MNSRTLPWPATHLLLAFHANQSVFASCPLLQYVKWSACKLAVLSKPTSRLCVHETDRGTAKSPEPVATSLATTHIDDLRRVFTSPCCALWRLQSSRQTADNRGTLTGVKSPCVLFYMNCMNSFPCDLDPEARCCISRPRGLLQPWRTEGRNVGKTHLRSGVLDANAADDFPALISSSLYAVSIRRTICQAIAILVVTNHEFGWKSIMPPGLAMTSTSIL